MDRVKLLLSARLFFCYLGKRKYCSFALWEPRNEIQLRRHSKLPQCLFKCFRALGCFPLERKHKVLLKQMLELTFQRQMKHEVP